MTPLAGIKVVELARILAGPWAGQVLADLGAEVVKVEGPEGDDTRGQVTRIMANALTSDTLDPADREYLVSIVAQRTGQTPEEAGARVDELWAQAQAAEATARDAADRARRIGMLVAFLTAASFLISAAAAYFAAVLGGNHRDKQVYFKDWSRPW